MLKNEFQIRAKLIVRNAKFGNFSEMANLLSVKSRVSSYLIVLFACFTLLLLRLPCIIQ